MSSPCLTSVQITQRELMLLHKLLCSLNTHDLTNAGFNEQDVDDFGGVFLSVREEAETQ